MNGGQEIIASLDSVFLDWPEFLGFDARRWCLMQG
jgi:hypothetical protein